MKESEMKSAIKEAVELLKIKYPDILKDKYQFVEKDSLIEELMLIDLWKKAFELGYVQRIIRKRKVNKILTKK